MEKVKPKYVEDIVLEWLKENGYDGLYNPGKCACEISDLFPCGGQDCYLECMPGYKTKIKPGSEYDFIISGEKKKGENKK